MNRAIEHGYSHKDPAWSNLGQGAPETVQLKDSAERVTNVAISEDEQEYGPVSGITALRQAVADFYNESFRPNKQSKYTFRNVAISGGGRAGLTRIAAALGNINLGHFIPDYTAYEELLAIFKAFTPIPIILDPKENYELSTESLIKEIRGRGLSAILASNPSNPTGRAVTGQKLAEWIRVAREEHCTFILDEFYSHYIYGGTPGTMISAAEYIEDVNTDPVLIVDGLTKNWRYPGFRISWTLGPENVIDAIASAGSFLDGGANHPLQVAALPLLTKETAQKEAWAIQKTFGEKREYAITRLRQMGFIVETEPEGAFYVWVNLSKLPSGLTDGMHLFETGLEEKVITVPGEFFDVNPGKRRSQFHSQYKNYARISFGPSQETVERGLDALERVIKKYS